MVDHGGGWMMHEDPSSGRSYYAHEDGTVTWEPPVVASAATASGEIEYFYQSSRGLEGPYPASHLQAWLEQGHLNAATPICPKPADGSTPTESQLRSITAWFSDAALYFTVPPVLQTVDSLIEMGGVDDLEDDAQEEEDEEDEGEDEFVEGDDDDGDVSGAFGAAAGGGGGDDGETQLEDYAGWLMKKQPRGNRFQKRWFVLETKPNPTDPEGKPVSEIFYFKHHRDKKPCKTPVSLEALKDVVNPSKVKGCIDLVFIDRTFVLKPVKKNTLSEMIFEAFGNLEPSEQAKLTDARGRELLVLQCEACGSLQGLREKQKQKMSRMRCSSCKNWMDTAGAIPQSEIRIHIVNCPWCSLAVRYPKGKSELQCPGCKNLIQIKDWKDDVQKQHSSKSDKADPALIAKLRALTDQHLDNERIIRELQEALSLLKQEIELAKNSKKGTRKKKKKERNRHEFGASQV